MVINHHFPNGQVALLNFDLPSIWQPHCPQILNVGFSSEHSLQIAILLDAVSDDATEAFPVVTTSFTTSKIEYLLLIIIAPFNTYGYL